MLLPLLLITMAVIAYAIARVWFWPDSFPLRVALEVSYHLVAATAAYRLVRYRWARWELGPWLLSASMLLLHLPWNPISRYLPPGFSLMVNLLAGLSMLLVVFDDYKLYTRRLGARPRLAHMDGRLRNRRRALLTGHDPHRFAGSGTAGMECQNFRDRPE